MADAVVPPQHGLVLSRKLGERIKIGEDIWVRVVDIDRGKIRLMISAPPDVKVYREEVIPKTEAQSDAHTSVQTGTAI